jgi:small subunit ribosomal protein S20
LPIIKSAMKQMRSSARKQQANKSYRSFSRTQVTKAEKSISSGDIEKAQQTVLSAVSALDKTSQKGIIHPNHAARRKSRLMKKLNTAKASVKA